MFSACWWRFNLVANYDVTKSSKPPRLPIIQLNISFQKQIDSYSYINDCFGDVNFVATKANLKKEDENVYFEYSILDFNISVWMQKM